MLATESLFFEHIVFIRKIYDGMLLSLANTININPVEKTGLICSEESWYLSFFIFHKHGYVMQRFDIESARIEHICCS